MLNSRTKDREMDGVRVHGRADPAESCSPEAPETFLRTEYLAALGRLSGGIAHEINTPVQFAGDSLYFLRDALGSILPLLLSYRRLAGPLGVAAIDGQLLEEIRAAEREADLEYLVAELPGVLERAEAGLQRIAEMTRAMQLADGAAGGSGTGVDVARTLHGAVTLARNEYKYVADIELALEALPALACDARLVKRAVLGLLLDAADSVVDGIAGTDRRGVIRIAARAEAGLIAITFDRTIPAPSASAPEGRPAAAKWTGRELAMACAAAHALGGSLEGAGDRAGHVRLLLPLEATDTMQRTS